MYLDVWEGVITGKGGGLCGVHGVPKGMGMGWKMGWVWHLEV